MIACDYRAHFPFVNRRRLKEPDGRYQYTIRYSDLVICICYQPPGVAHFHQNKGPGVASEAVYVIKGSYTSELVDTVSDLVNKHRFNSIPFNHKTVYIEEKEFRKLGSRKGFGNYDTAGLEGAFMLHFNSRTPEIDHTYAFYGPDTNKVLSTELKEKTLLCLEGDVYVNGAKMPLLSRVFIPPSTPYNIVCAADGRLLSIEK